jgi:hypothetical protein
MDQNTKSPGKARCRLPLAEIGICIVALECSQILYNGLARPDLTGDLARVLVADASGGAPGETSVFAPRGPWSKPLFRSW